MMAVYVWNRVLKTAGGACAYTAKAHFEDAKYRTEAEFLSQELDEFVDANTVSRLIGNPLRSDLCLRLCVLWTLGNPGVVDALQWFVDCPDPNWGEFIDVICMAFYVDQNKFLCVICDLTFLKFYQVFLVTMVTKW